MTYASLKNVFQLFQDKYSIINLDIKTHKKPLENSLRQCVYVESFFILSTNFVIRYIPMYFWFHPVCGYKRIPEWKWIEHELAFFKILHKLSLVNLAISEAFSTGYTEWCSHLDENTNQPRDSRWDKKRFIRAQSP